jgi:hypothetical protein
MDLKPGLGKAWGWLGNTLVSLTLGEVEGIGKSATQFFYHATLVTLSLDLFL